MNNVDVNKLINEEMMRVDDKQLKNFAHTIWIMYSCFIREGFTKQQAMSLIKGLFNPRGEA